MAGTSAAEHLARAALAATATTPEEAYSLLTDVGTLLKRVRTAHASSDKPLTLPAGVDEDLRQAQEALFAGLRRLEEAITRAGGQP